MKRSFFLLALLACSSSQERDGFARLATSINPTLEKLRPIAARVRDLQDKSDPESRQQLLAICGSRNTDLQLLVEQETLFEGVELSREPRVGVPLRAKGLFDAPMESCRVGGDPDLCLRGCAQGWAGLTTAIDRIGTAAAKHDVKLVSLGR
jgi:hypothetical protein